MGEEFEPLRADKALPPRLSHRRILFLMAAIVAVGAILGSVLIYGKFGGGVLTGGIIAFVNYYWQRNSTRTIFEKAEIGERSTFISARFILRYLVIGVLVGFFYVTEALPIVAVILGLAAFTFAVVVEGILSIFLNRS